MYNNIDNIAVPYGVVMFAFLGAVAIPEMSEELGKKKKLLKKAIIIGGIVPIAAYSMFAIAVVGVTGMETSEVATVHLGEVFGKGVALFANLFAVFAMSTSFFALGLALKQMYDYDYKINKTLSWAATISVPLIAFLAGVHDFVPLLALLGAGAGGSELTMIVLMHGRAKKLGNRKPEYSINSRRIAGTILIAMFAAGVAYQIIS